MKKFILIILILFIFKGQIFSAWVDVDGVGKEAINIYQNNQSDYVPEIVLDSNNYAHIVWFSETGSGNTDIFYLKWNGSQWVDADGTGTESINISNTSGVSKYPKIQLDLSGNPHIVWQEGNDIYYLKYNGIAWVDVDGTGQESANISNSPMTASHHPSFILDNSGKPHITWHEGNEEEPPLAQVIYATWNGSTWTGADGGSVTSIDNSSYSSLWVSIAVDSNNYPHIVWEDGEENNREIYYLKWNGSSWVDVDGIGQESINISNTPGYSSWPFIIIDAFDNPHIVYEDASAGNLEVYYQKWNGNSWVDVDGTGLESKNVSSSFTNSAVSKIKIDNSGVPHIMWHEGNVETCEVYCLKWNGSNWVDEDGYGRDEMRVSRDFINSEWGSMVLDSYGCPHIVWSNGVVLQEHDIYYLRWLPGGASDTPTVTPTFTIDLTNSITPIITPTPQEPCWVDADRVGQESKIISPGKKPSLALDSAGNPGIAWEKDSSIFYLKWNGSQWVDADGAGQEAKKISYSILNCKSPFLCFDSNDIPCIALPGGLWIGWLNIFYLKWNGAYWADIDGDGVESISINAPTGGYPQDVKLYLDNSNNPHLGWSDYPLNLTWTTKDIFYIKWNGNTWVDVDGSFYESVTLGVNTDGWQISPDFVLDNLNRPNIVWVMENPDIITPGYSALRFLKWNGSSWVDMDGAGVESMNVLGPGSYDIRDPVIRLDSSGNPHIVWSGWSSAGSFQPRINYLYWNGSSWVDVDGAGVESMSLPFSDEGYGPSLAIDPSDNSHISFYSSTGVYYMRWNGYEWVDADGTGLESVKIDNNSFDSLYGFENNTSLALDNQDRPSVSWYDDLEGMDYIYYLRYDCSITTPTITPTFTISPTFTITPSISETPTLTITPTITITPTPFPEGFFVVYPNPYDARKSKDKKIKFLNVKPGSSIFIFTISGENVIAILSKTNNIVNWDLKNRFGYKVSPGIYYFFYITADNEIIEKGKIFVINNQ